MLAYSTHGAPTVDTACARHRAHRNRAASQNPCKPHLEHGVVAEEQRDNDERDLSQDEDDTPVKALRLELLVQLSQRALHTRVWRRPVRPLWT